MKRIIWRSLKPYQQLQGSAPNHALTEYYFDIFRIDLTLEGYLFLQQQVAANSRLIWFSIDDIEKGETVDGKIAYIKALYDDYVNDRTALKADLLALPNSFSCGYLFKREKYGLTLLLNTNKPLFAGVLGKEKVVDIILTERQQQLLFGLAAHNRGFAFETLIDTVILHPFAWIEVNDLGLQKELIELASLFSTSEFILENKQDKFFRWSVSPDMIYFDAKLFTYSVKKSDLSSVNSKISVSITRAVLSTILGEVANKKEDFLISLNLASGLHNLNQQQYSTDNHNAKKTEDLHNKKFFKDKNFLALGLKGLVREEASVFEFCTHYQVLDSV